MSRRVVAVVNNLFFVAKLQSAARQASVDLTFASTEDELLEKARAGAELVVFDLGDQDLQALAAIKRLRSEPDTADVPMLGFLRHTQPEVAERARAAGCENVMPRSQFSAQLVDLLRG
ncbi:MAG TPA: hypothetical protein VJB88_05350 [Vicinamibacteria bacterium]|nr:hypothetical protein [Vicinamibacteria bacterium]